jgi:hypothetical protein
MDAPDDARLAGLPWFCLTSILRSFSPFSISPPKTERIIAHLCEFCNEKEHIFRLSSIGWEGEFSTQMRKGGGKKNDSAGGGQVRIPP